MPKRLAFTDYSYSFADAMPSLATVEWLWQEARCFISTAIRLVLSRPMVWMATCEWLPSALRDLRGMAWAFIALTEDEWAGCWKNGRGLEGTSS